MLRTLDLFSGIGGFSLGLERTAGFKTVAFCEIEPSCRRLLKHHWPNVPCYEDVRDLSAERLAADGITVDAICGGFPCQDLSAAGDQAGLDGERSGLVFELLRLVRELRPGVVVMENVTDLLYLGLGRVLGELAKIRYNAWWDCIPGCAIGADHERDRIWIVAYPDRNGSEEHPQCGRLERREEVGADAADADRARLARGLQAGTNAFDVVEFVSRVRSSIAAPPAFPREHWAHKPVLGRGAHGIPGRVDRVHGLGNAVVPQIPELIGRAILASRVAA